VLIRANFPKQHRLLRRQDFVALSSSTTVFSGRLILVVWQSNTLGYPRLGVTASKRAGNAVVRNRIKRLVREFFRQQRMLLPAVDLNVIVRRQAADAHSAVLFAELLRAFRQIGSTTCCHACS